MEQVISIQIDSFRECMKLAQRAVYAGLATAAVVQFLAAAPDASNLPSVPFTDLEFSSIDQLWVALAILYVGSGLTACFATSRAFSVLMSIQDISISAELSRYPSLIATSFIYSLFLAVALTGSGFLLMANVTDYGYIREYWYGAFLASPYFLALQMGARIYRHKEALTKSSKVTPQSGAP